MPLRTFIKLLIVLLSLALIGSAQSFTRTEFSVGGQPANVVSADFNGDGVADLAVTNSTGNYVSILLGRGDGTFASASNVTTNAGPTELVTADFNGDGQPDIAITSKSSAAITVLLGNGDGSFRRIDVAAGGGQVSITAGDFNSDGKIDLAAALQNSVQILVGNGDGTFAPGSSFTTAVAPAQVRAADLNADGKLDLAIGACCQGSDVTYGAFYVYGGNGDGTFGSKFSSDQADGTKLTVADVTGDGLPELILPYVGCHTPCAGVEVVVNGGNFNFSRFGGGGEDGGLYYGGRGPAAVADFDGDGKPEVASSAGPGNGDYGRGYDKVLIWQVGTDGKFARQGDYLIGTNTGPWGMATADFNHDGKTDFAIVEQRTGKIAVFLNNTGSADAKQTFELSMQYSPQTVKAGNAAQYGFSLEATNGTLPSDTQMWCAGLPTGTACSFDRPPTGSFVNGFLKITTTAPASAALHRSVVWLGLVIPFGVVVLPLRGRKMAWLGVLALILAVALCVGCGGGSKSTASTGTAGGTNSSGASGGESSGGTSSAGSSGGSTGGTNSGGTTGGSAGTPVTPTPPPPPASGPTPAGNYQVTVTAVGGGITQSQVVTLVVQ